MTPADRDVRARHVRNGYVRREDELRAWRMQKHRRRPRRHRLLSVAFLAVVAALVAAVCWQGARLAHADELPATVTPAPSWTPEPDAELQESPRFEPASRGGGRDADPVERWRPLLEEYGDWNVDQGLSVIRCESRGDPTAVNRSSGAIGLWQTLGWEWVALRLFGSSELTNPRLNTAVAHVLWLDSGGTFRWHWAASRGCWS